MHAAPSPHLRPGTSDRMSHSARGTASGMFMITVAGHCAPRQLPRFPMYLSLGKCIRFCSEIKGHKWEVGGRILALLQKGKGVLFSPGYKGSFQWLKQLFAAKDSSISNGEAKGGGEWGQGGETGAGGSPRQTQLSSVPATQVPLSLQRPPHWHNCHSHS